MTKTKNDVKELSKSSTKDAKKKAIIAKNQKDSNRKSYKKEIASSKNTKVSNKILKTKATQFTQKEGGSQKSKKNIKVKTMQMKSTNYKDKSKKIIKKIDPKSGMTSELQSTLDSKENEESPNDQSSPKVEEKTILNNNAQTNSESTVPVDSEKVSKEQASPSVGDESAGEEKNAATQATENNTADGMVTVKARTTTNAATSGESEESKNESSNTKETENDTQVETTKDKETTKTQTEDTCDDDEECTKPTINQMKKCTRKLRTLSQDDKISQKECEQLNDELTELYSSIQTLKHSYASIMNSLVAIQKRRPKRNRKGTQKFGLISTASTAQITETSKEQGEQEVDCFDISFFLNPSTRQEAFKILFSEIEKLQKTTEKFRSCFDSRGQFSKQKFSINCLKQVSRQVYNQWTLHTHRSQMIVDEIIRNYNDDLLNLFRL